MHPVSLVGKKHLWKSFIPTDEHEPNDNGLISL